MLSHVTQHLAPLDLGRLRTACSALRYHPAVLERAERVSLLDSFSHGTAAHFLPRLSCLRRLSLHRLDSVFDVHRLAALPLRKIVITGVPVLDLHPLHAFGRLRVLVLDRCTTHVGLPGLSLTKLRLSHTPGNDCVAAGPLQVLELCTLEDLQPLVQLTRLKLLPLEEQYSETAAIDTFKALSQLPHLSVLNSSAGPVADLQIHRLKQISQLTVRLHASEAARLLPTLSGLTALRRLALLGVWNLPNSRGLCLPDLTALLLLCDFKAGVGLQASMPSLWKCRSLQQLHLRLCLGYGGTLTVESGDLPLERSITILHSVSRGSLYFDSSVAARCVIIDVPNPKRWEEFPDA